MFRGHQKLHEIEAETQERSICNPAKQHLVSLNRQDKSKSETQKPHQEEKVENYGFRYTENSTNSQNAK